MFCDNTCAIAITQNPILHARTKHIEVRHHFIRDHVERGHIELLRVGTEDQLADIFTKPLQENRFITLRHSPGLLELPNKRDKCNMSAETGIQQDMTFKQHKYVVCKHFS